MAIRLLLFLLFLVLFHRFPARLEGLDLLGDALLALGVRETVDLVLQALSLPVLLFLRRLECWVLTDGSISILIDLLYILRANAIRKVGRELLLEAEDDGQDDVRTTSMEENL